MQMMKTVYHRIDLTLFVVLEFLSFVICHDVQVLQ
jgi:hypothetical protein